MQAEKSVLSTLLHSESLQRISCIPIVPAKPEVFPLQFSEDLFSRHHVTYAHSLGTFYLFTRQL